MDPTLRHELRTLLASLLAVAREHPEIFDTDVRERMFEAVYHGFLKPQADFVLPSSFGMFSDEANQQVKEALGLYIQNAGARAEEIGMVDPNERLAAFQDDEVEVEDMEEGTLAPDDFFGWAGTI